MIQVYKISGSPCLIVVIITILSVLIFGHMIHYTHVFGHMIHYTHAQHKSTLQLSTDKKTYKPGETVAITLKNNDKNTLEFSDSTLGLTVQNAKTHQKAGILGSQVMSELKPGESKTVRWDQKDYDGKQVVAGTYDARTSSAALENSNNTSLIAVSATFTIS